MYEDLRKDGIRAHGEQEAGSAKLSKSLGGTYSQKALVL